MLSNRDKYKKYLNDVDAKTYDEFLEILKIEIGDLFRDAEHGKSVIHSGLKARKKSIKIRDLLKIFRKKSLILEKELGVKRKERQDRSSITL